MRRDLVLRIRLPRPTARALIAAGLLAIPVSNLSPFIQQGAYLSTNVPDDAAGSSFVSLTTNHRTVLGKAGGSQTNTIIMTPQNCGLTNPNAIFVNNPPVPTAANCPCTPGGPCSVRSVYAPGAILLPTSSAMYPHVLDVSGDIVVDRLCFWGNAGTPQCSTY